MTRPSWLACCALALTLGCGRAGQPRPVEEMSFRVDSTRLGERLEDSARGFALGAPARWDALPPAAIEEAMRRVRAAPGTDSSREPRLLALYRQPPEGAALAVSSFPCEFSPDALDSLRRDHIARLKGQFPAGKVEEGRYTYRGFEVLQFRVVDSQQVLFKLLVSRPRSLLLQLDYVIPRGVYQRELESVESSIGSLRPLS